MSIRWQPKRPSDVIIYRHDWSGFLGSATISNSVFSVTGATKVNQAVEAGNQSVNVEISGGVTGTTARISNTITTSTGETATETFTVGILDYGEPIDLATVKAHLRVVDDSEDGLIGIYLSAARQWVERRTGHVLVQRPIVETFNGLGSYLDLSLRPVVSVSDLNYVGLDGTTQTLTFTSSSNRYPYRLFPIAGQYWPRSYWANNTATVSYIAGYGDGDAPLQLIQAVLMLVGHFYENRESVAIDTRGMPTEVPLSVTSLCDQFTTPGL